MLKKVTLTNFKCYEGANSFELAPLTLIYGPNSAGKSTLLQALKLTKQTHDLADRDTRLLFTAPNGLVDCASYENIINGHDASKPLGIAFEFDRRPPTDIEIGSADLTTLPMRHLWPADGAGDNAYPFIVNGDWTKAPLEYRYSVTYRLEKQRHPLAWPDQEALLRPRISRIELGADNSPVIMQAEPLGDEDNWYYDTILFFTVVEKCEAAYRFFFKHRDALLRGLDRHRSNAAAKSAVLTRTELVYAPEVDLLSSQEYESAYRCLEERYRPLIDLYSREFTFDEYKSTSGKELCVTSLEPKAFLPEFSNWEPEWRNEIEYLHLSGNEMARMFDKFTNCLCFEESWDASLGNRDEILRAIAPTTNPMALRLWIKFFGIELDHFWGNLRTLDSVRPPPQSVYAISDPYIRNPTANSIGFVHLLAGKRDVMDRVNDWLNRMQIGYEIDVVDVGPNLPDHYAVRMYDIRGAQRIPVRLADVGYGLSQILPIVVKCLTGWGETILIEQPELHVHPRLQADLGSLFREAVRCNHHQLIVETHSEHLMLRIQKLIRKGDLKADDVSVLYVSRGEDGSTVQRLRLDTDGEFLDPWPNGFFPERAAEILGS